MAVNPTCQRDEIRRPYLEREGGSGAPGPISGLPAGQPLTGAELAPLVQALLTIKATAGEIAALAKIFNTTTRTIVSNTVGTVITAGALASGWVDRSGPTAAFNDTTDTAVNIAAAGRVGYRFFAFIKNTTAFSQVILPGVGVTLPGANNPIPANTFALFLVQITSATTVSFLRMFGAPFLVTNPEVAIPLITVGNGIVTAAGIATQLTTRGGAQAGAAFTDTTDGSANITAAQPKGTRVGQSWEWTYRNNTDAVATLAGGANVTVSGITKIPPNSWARYLVTRVTTSLYTIQAVASGFSGSTTGTFIANGVTPVSVPNTAVTGSSNILFTLKTVGGTVGAHPTIQTITPGSGFTVAASALDTSTYNYVILG